MAHHEELCLNLARSPVLKFNHTVLIDPAFPTAYRLAKGLSARFLGAEVIVLGVVVIGLTAIVSVFRLQPLPIFLTGLTGLATVLATAYYLARRHYVVQLTSQGYDVRFLRGAGVTGADWTEVEGIFSAWVAGSPCLVIRLIDGRTTIIPVVALNADRDEFAATVRLYLEHGHGLAPLA